VLRPLPQSNPQNRWRQHRVEYDVESVPPQSLQIYEDETANLISENDSPDVPFRFSVNPYRGCAHGCAYCYARPTHEYLGFGSGTDFERKIVVKPRAAELLRAAFERKSWSGESIMFSGNTDCFQPLEADLRLTRQCLEVCLEYRNPVHVITKSSLIERDLELLQCLHEQAAAGVTISVTFWDPEVARAMEPYAPAPARRIETIRRLAARGIPVSVNMAPLIPGLSDRDLIPILEAARDAGALSAAAILLRLPGSAAEVFAERLQHALPLRAEKILRRVREMRGGALNDSRFHARMSGEGSYAQTLMNMFTSTVSRLGFGDFPEAKVDTFRRPGSREQLSLFR
jgi:DNA repair photolyase